MSTCEMVRVIAKMTMLEKKSMCLMKMVQSRTARVEPRYH